MPEVSEEDLKKMSPEEIAELQKQNCIFCKIASKEIPAKIIHEDKKSLCILDINPASEGHILVIPKEHYMILPHVPDDILLEMMKNVQLMSNTMLKTLQCKGTSIFIANGVASGQRAPHVLIHVIPRKDGDGLLPLPNYEMSPEQTAKLQNSLSGYITEIISGKPAVKSKVKEAEFTEEKSIPKKEAVKHVPSKKENAPTTDEEEQDEDEDSEEQEEKKEPPKKESQKSIPKKPINLDDISRLFG